MDEPGLYEPGLYPVGLIPPWSITSGFSGCMLWINCSTGTAVGGALMSVVCAIGLVMGMFEFGGRNLCGKFSWGIG